MLPSTPFFSIIIPALNEAKYLPHLLTDLTQQSFTSFEVIVVDGHSDDATVAQAQSFSAKLPALTLLTSPKRNVSFQRNLGAKTAQADWLIFMDADNRLPPYFLQGIKYRVEMEHPAIFTTYFLPDSQEVKDKAIARIINTYIDLQKKTQKPSCLESLMGFYHPVFYTLSGFNPIITFAEGVDILTRAKKKNYCLSVFKDPQYIYSFRRFRTHGTLKLIQNVSYYQLAKITHQPLNYERLNQLYPMKGGTYFDKPKNERTTFEVIFDELIKPRSLESEFSKIRRKLKVDDWLKA